MPMCHFHQQKCPHHEAILKDQRFDASIYSNQYNEKGAAPFQEQNFLSRESFVWPPTDSSISGPGIFVWPPPQIQAFREILFDPPTHPGPS